MSADKKSLYKYLAAYLFLWIILFEFILPVNKILPKPSIVIQAFPSLFADYNLLPNYISTVAVIYISMIAAYFTLKILSYIGEKENRAIINFIDSLEWFSDYIPGIVLGILLIFWFPGSEYVEFLFAYLTAFSQMILRYRKTKKNVPEEYIIASEAVGFSGKEISRRVVWKFGQAELFRRMKYVHYSLWVVLIAFEYIKGGYGIGNIFQKALLFKDLSALFSTSIIVAFTVFIGNTVILYMRNKLIFWK